MSFPIDTPGPVAGIWGESATQRHPLGTRMALGDGRVYRYALNGAVALSIARLCQESVVISGHGTNMVVAAAAAIGASQVTITNNTTAITANMYKDGFLLTNDEAGEGQLCKIKSHPAAAATANCVLTLYDEFALTVALTIASQVGLRKNPYKDVIVAPTSVTGIPVGVCPIAVTAAYYFWMQTWGPAVVLTNGTVILGKTVVPSATTAGAVDVTPLNSVGAEGQHPVVGIVETVGLTAEFSLVFLTLAP